MKPGDLVRMKHDDVIGMIMKKSKDAEFVTWGTCWYVYWYSYRKTITSWEGELELISESR